MSDQEKRIGRSSLHVRCDSFPFLKRGGEEVVEALRNIILERLFSAGFQARPYDDHATAFFKGRPLPVRKEPLVLENRYWGRNLDLFGRTVEIGGIGLAAAVRQFAANAYEVKEIVRSAISQAIGGPILPQNIRNDTCIYVAGALLDPPRVFSPDHPSTGRFSGERRS